MNKNMPVNTLPDETRSPIKIAQYFYIVSMASAVNNRKRRSPRVVFDCSLTDNHQPTILAMLCADHPVNSNDRFRCFGATGDCSMGAGPQWTTSPCSLQAFLALVS